MILKFLLKNFGKTSVLPVLPKYGYVPGLSLAFRRLALFYTKWVVMIYKGVVLCSLDFTTSVESIGYKLKPNT